MDLQWEESGFRAGDGSAYPLVWGDTPDIACAHEAVDAWAHTCGLAEALTGAQGYSLWWHLRFKLVHDVLFRGLPRMRALLALRETAGERAHVHLAGASDDWALALTKAVFPRASAGAPGLGAPVLLPWKRRASRLARAIATAQRLRRLPAPKAGCPRVLVVCQARYWDGRRDSLLQGVIDALDAQGMEPVIFVQSHMGNAVGLRGLRTRPRGHLFGDVVYGRARRSMHVAMPALPAGKPLEFEGIDLSPMVRGFLAREAVGAAREQATWLATLPALTREIAPRAVVLVDENGAEQFPHSGFADAGLPTVAVQHGCIHRDHLHYIFPREIAPSRVPLATRTCVFGEHYANLLTRDSIYPDESVVVTGPAHTSRKEADIPARAHAFRRDVLPSGCDTLLLLTSQDTLHALLGPRFFARLREAPRNVHAVVRPHPREWAQGHWPACAAAHGVADRVTVAGSPGLDVMLAACDFHCSACSTVLGEAVALGKPNIVVGGKAVGDWMGVLEAGVAVDLDDCASLEEAMTRSRAMNTEGARNAYVARHFQGDRGPEAIAGVVESIVGAAS